MPLCVINWSRSDLGRPLRVFVSVFRRECDCYDRKDRRILILGNNVSGPTTHNCKSVKLPNLRAKSFTRASSTCSSASSSGGSSRSSADVVLRKMPVYNIRSVRPKVNSQREVIKQQIEWALSFISC